MLSLPSSALIVREFDGKQFCEYELGEIKYDEDGAFYLQMACEMANLNASAVNVDLKEFCIFVQELLLRITGASLAFVGEVLTDAATGPFLRTWATSEEGSDWNFRVHRLMYKEPFVDFKNMENLFGTAILEKHIVFSHDPANDPRATGVPCGHAPLKSFVGIPLVHDQTLIGLLGIANFKEPFTRRKLRKLCPLLDCVAGSFAMQLHARRWVAKEKRASERKRATVSPLRVVLQSAVALMASEHVTGRDRDVARKLSENASKLFTMYSSTDGSPRSG